jgi:hypothetical protein
MMRIVQASALGRLVVNAHECTYMFGCFQHACTIHTSAHICLGAFSMHIRSRFHLSLYTACYMCVPVHVLFCFVFYVSTIIIV